ncbi:MBL fold metallo-hydrolase [Polymorphobacter arshaanensis]|uniref:MBL fold metallo-hydrolase n=1 Tax=Glacieibacterium arshaanense TaxID=2511025 RepID=A0A4Y9EM08_9SPHN|nr:MBL fold metallo-hydrolase [Polymorphobacter arshaanensis]TFU03042.1 MBL fold metallo-hydrolase [Polymorphobacter arshaanensis]
MRTVTKVIASVAALAVVAGAVAYSQRGAIAQRMFVRGVTAAMATDPIKQLPDGLHVILCGAGSPLPDPTRAGPCVAVVAGQRLFVVDVGDGAVRKLGMMGINASRAEAVLLTHFHSDHIDGLGGFMLQHWGGGASKAPLPVHGPQGVEQVVAGFNEAYKLDSGYRIAHHGPGVMPPSGIGGVALPFQITQGGPSAVLIDTPDLKVTAFPVDHAPVEPAVGYKFVYKGRTVVISGDNKPSKRVEAEAKGADLLVHEALSPELVKIQETAALKGGRINLAHVFADIPGYHTSPTAAAAIAQAAGVKMLLLDHIVPGLPFKALEIPFVGDARSKFSGPLQVGHDGDRVSLPANSDKIETGSALRF